MANSKRGLSRIPTIPKLEIGQIMNNAGAGYDRNEPIFPIQSELEGFAYILSEDEVVIASSHSGYMRMHRRVAKLMAQELLECLEVMPR